MRNVALFDAKQPRLTRPWKESDCSGACQGKLFQPGGQQTVETFIEVCKRGECGQRLGQARSESGTIRLSLEKNCGTLQRQGRIGHRLKGEMVVVFKISFDRSPILVKQED